MGGDEAIDLAKDERVLGPQELNSSDTDAIDLPPDLLLGLAQGDQSNIVARVAPHHLACTHRPVEPLHPALGVLYHHRRHLRSLAITHLSDIFISPRTRLHTSLHKLREAEGEGE